MRVSASDILAHLQGVRVTGPDRWIARCPAHEDRAPSLSIREAEDRTLLHCFAGCSPLEVVESIGLTLTDLFPSRSTAMRRQRIPAADALRCIDAEATLVLVAARALSDGEVLESDMIARIARAAGRISEAVRAAGLTHG